jgi:hypothetical protein
VSFNEEALRAYMASHASLHELSLEQVRQQSVDILMSVCSELAEIPPTFPSIAASVLIVMMLCLAQLLAQCEFPMLRPSYQEGGKGWPKINMATKVRAVRTRPAPRALRGEMMGSHNCGIVGESQSVLMMIDPIIVTRTAVEQMSL